MSRAKVHVVSNWKSVLTPRTNPYINRSAIVRWLFYRRIADLLALARRSGEARVLEIGCWEGYALPTLLRRYREVWAIDNDTSSLRDSVLVSAKGLCESELGAGERMHLIKADAKCTPFPAGAFDVILCIDMLPYVAAESRIQVLHECRRMLRPGGEILFSLPIEVGPVLLLRETGRVWSGSWRDDYSASDLLMAACFRPRAGTREAPVQNLRGYDYREDLKRIRSIFRVDVVRYSPFAAVGRLNPFALVRGGRV